MESFEDLGLGPELIEALASEGIEEPTPFQVAAIPVMRKGNNLLGRAGPGAGTLVAYGAALLDRLDPGAGAPRALVIAASADSARRLAESLAAVAHATGHSVASIGSPWVLPERADLLFGSATELLGWARSGKLKVEGVQALVIDQAGAIERTSGLGEVEALLEFLPKEAQRVVLALPVTPEIEDFVERHARRAIQVPPHAVEGAAEAGPKRGEVRYRIVEEPREAGALQLVSELLEDARHVCLFFASEDRAADVGDFLTLHGYGAGAPGDESAPVWLAVGELDARAPVESAEAVPVSYDAPVGPDSLDRRHGQGRSGVVVVLPREMPHLRDVSKRTGYRVVPFPPPVATTARGEMDSLIARLDAAVDGGDLTPWLIALEPLLARRGAAEVAAAAVSLLRERGPADAAPATSSAPQTRAAAPAQRAAEKAPTIKRAAGASAPPAPAAFVRLFISIGERDGAGPGDLVGAITGEAGVEGSQVGRIDIRDTFSVVEVQEPIAERVIRALNGITVRGRSVRADYDRGGPARGGSDRPQRPKREGPRGEGGREGGAREGGRERSGPARGGWERDRGGRDREGGARPPRSTTGGPRGERPRPPREGAPGPRSGAARGGPPRGGRSEGRDRDDAGDERGPRRGGPRSGAGGGRGAGGPGGKPRAGPGSGSRGGPDGGSRGAPSGGPRRGGKPGPGGKPGAKPGGKPGGKRPSGPPRRPRRDDG